MLSGIGRRQHWDAGSHGAFGAVRPFRAILPTAKRRAPSAHEPRTATPLRRPRAVRLSVHQIVWGQRENPVYYAFLYYRVR